MIAREETELEPSEDCLLCGATQPPGHAVVYGESGQRVGRVCSYHTLKELAFSDRFLVRIELVEEAESLTDPATFC